MNLPNFTDHDLNRKNAKLLEPGTGPYPLMRDWLADHAKNSNRTMRVLDLGCGRGATVAWLCAAGYDAYGVDVDPLYVSNGCGYFAENGFGGDRLRVVESDGSYPFDDDFFDLIVSTDVLEHVANLENLAFEMARVLSPGGRALHIYPATWRFIEAHMMTPLAHWFPKKWGRKAAIRIALALGLSADFFANRPLADRVEIFFRFSRDETFYRSVSSTKRVFSRYDLSFDPLGPAKRRVESKLPQYLAPISSLLASIYAHFFVVYAEVRSVKPEAGGH